MARPVAEFRRPEIIEGLRVTLISKGVSMPSNDDIAKNAGMSRQLVRHYYSRQQPIAVDLAKRLAVETQEALNRGLNQSLPAKRLDFLLDFLFGMVADDELRMPGDAPVEDALLSLAVGDDLLKTELNEEYSVLINQVSGEISRAYPAMDHSASLELAGVVMALASGHRKLASSLGLSSQSDQQARTAAARIIASYAQQDTLPMQQAAEESN
ncbi:TetR/AcrR family transcriptional regulator [Parvularcula sp. LCG005]|uniref:TetR/AcrR family transcriptional regulator n=1 Tax=Parvularcula sp. LCG005 TaxID=3078805 RepID=UPI002943377B|nr:TetR/AcrR family transcriptional regulator [Parvularcula sp. LCG005]WOI53864.1 TetR/AcrR family transcriptional regulator [Parvularcula sp. LCG005]